MVDDEEEKVIQHPLANCNSLARAERRERRRRVRGPRRTMRIFVSLARFSSLLPLFFSHRWAGQWGGHASQRHPTDVGNWSSRFLLGHDTSRDDSFVKYQVRTEANTRQVWTWCKNGPCLLSFCLFRCVGTTPCSLS